jgi:hypothetical protein
VLSVFRKEPSPKGRGGKMLEETPQSYSLSRINEGSNSSAHPPSSNAWAYLVSVGQIAPASLCCSAARSLRSLAIIRTSFAGSFSADICLHISKISCMAVYLTIQQISSGQASLPMRLCARLSGMKLALLSRLCVTSRTWDGLDLFDC